MESTEPAVNAWEAKAKLDLDQYFCSNVQQEPRNIAPRLEPDLQRTEQVFTQLLSEIKNKCSGSHPASNPSGNKRSQSVDEGLQLAGSNITGFSAEQEPRIPIELVGTALELTGENTQLADHATQLWPLAVPALLNALDKCRNSADRIRAALVVAQLAISYPRQLIKSGLFKAFFDSVSIGLLTLPPSEDFEISTRVVGSSLYAAIKLCSAVSSSNPEYSEPDQRLAERMLHKLMRDGPIRALKHADGNLIFIHSALQWLQVLIHLVGVGVIAHTDVIVKMLTAILSDPFNDLEQAKPNIYIADECLAQMIDLCPTQIGQYRFDIALALARANILTGHCSDRLRNAYDDGPLIVDTMSRTVQEKINKGFAAE